MQSISEFFGRMKGRQAQEIYTRTVAQEALKKCLGIDLPLEAIYLSGRNLNLKGLDQSAKSAVFIKKSAILKEIAVKLPDRGLTDIKY